MSFAGKYLFVCRKYALINQAGEQWISGKNLIG